MRVNFSFFHTVANLHTKLTTHTRISHSQNRLELGSRFGSELGLIQTKVPLEIHIRI